MSKRLNVSLLFLSLFILLSGCSLSDVPDESKVKVNVNKNTSNTESYKVGEVIAKAGNNSYYYSGVIDSRVVITAVINEHRQSATAIPIYVDYKNTFGYVKLPNSKITIRIKNVDKAGGVNIITENSK